MSEINETKSKELKQKQAKLNKMPKDHAWYDSMNENANQRLNQLRAAVLGANDGVVSTAGLVLGMVGATSAKLGRANTKRAVIRNLVGGILAMTITYAIGYLFGVNL
ncbi:VIT1/CCC1 transporter family protein [Criibacterium bergeronii]|uniref:hypothetical protein n=1 Tax=Criibacterium bergeronii TaxID=1871336 RepID=UPI000827D8B3|nr:hypothetical protein [Criibacterium bergeronii]MBS6062779.1 hypothetical protein [Peptostreptococcaceae bacterium]